MTGTGLTKSVHEVLRRSGKMQVERHIGLEESTICTFRIRHISVCCISELRALRRWNSLVFL